MRCALLACVLLAATACVTPRSVAMGYTAAPVGRGGAEVALTTGVGYSSMTSPPVRGTDGNGQPTTTQTVTRGFGLPTFEANAQFGFNQHVALNLHASTAGLQPGLKLTLNKSRNAKVALLPQVGVGYSSVGQSTFAAGVTGQLTEANPSSTTMFIFTAGLKFLVWHKSGFYGGLGYELMLTRSAQTGTVGTGNASQPFQTLATSAQHQIGAALGWDVVVGFLRIRPEIAAAVVPGISTNYTSGGVTTEGTGGFAFAILPSFTVAAVTPFKELTAEEEAESRPDPERDDRRLEEDGGGDEVAPERD